MNLQTQTERFMKLKKPNINYELSSLVFVDKDTKSLLIHVHGFEDTDIAEEFANYMLKKSGMKYHPSNDLFNSLTSIH